MFLLRTAIKLKKKNRRFRSFNNFQDIYSYYSLPNVVWKFVLHKVRYFKCALLFCPSLCPNWRTVIASPDVSVLGAFCISFQLSTEQGVHYHRREHSLECKVQSLGRFEITSNTLLPLSSVRWLSEVSGKSEHKTCSKWIGAGFG